MGPAGHGTPDPEVLVTAAGNRCAPWSTSAGGRDRCWRKSFAPGPTVRGTLVDLPPTVARSVEIFQAAGVADRVTAVGQSFFDPLPAGADLYLLKNVLGDWPDREAMAILRRCAEAARPAGRVVVLGGVSPDEDGGPSPDLLMMVLVGGKDRSLTEFRELARAAGLEVQAAGRQPSGRFVVSAARQPDSRSSTGGRNCQARPPWRPVVRRGHAQDLRHKGELWQ